MKAIAVSLSAVLFAGTASAVFGKPPPKPDVTMVEGFVWNNPFKTEAIEAFDATCETRVNFPALEYTLHDLMKEHPKGLKPWANGLKKVFSGKEYPGGWFGLDRHLHDRSLLLLAYDEVPIAVREWIEEQERSEGKAKGLFPVFEKPKEEDEEITEVVGFPSADKIDRSQDSSKVLIFAPGAMYRILPLWNAEFSNCKDDLLDLSRYSPTLEDNAVMAWVEHTESDENKMLFQVEAKIVKAKSNGKATQEVPEIKASEAVSREEL